LSLNKENLRVKYSSFKMEWVNLEYWQLDTFKEKGDASEGALLILTLDPKGGHTFH
jgi:hypothetical protein